MTARTGGVAFGADPSSVPAARRFVREALAGTDGPVDDVELVVTELVTNAVLHGEGPIDVELVEDASAVTVRVTDRGRGMPVSPLEGAVNMTGRGLGLVAALSDRWGVDRHRDSKTVWAELTPGGPARASEPLDPDELLDAWADLDDPGEARYSVRLTGVPTSLLVEAKTQIDNLVRELTLARAAPGTDTPLSRLIATVTDGFAEARAEIKRQALAAARRGDPLTDIELRLAESAADAALEYLAALEETDRYARAARLLTLEAPPAHRVFRRWYLTALAEHLRALASGAAPPAPTTFPEALAEELTSLANLKDAWDRLLLLQQLTSEMAASATVEEIAARFVRSARQGLHASTCRVYLLEPDGWMRAVAVDSADADLAERFAHMAPDPDLPAWRVLATGETLLLRNRSEIEAGFPALAGAYPSERSLMVARLAAGDTPLGVISLTFLGGGWMDEQIEKGFVSALADALAQALQRAQATQRAADAGERLAFLADASIAFAATLTPFSAVRAVGGVMVPRLADWCVVQVVEGDHLQTLGVHHLERERLEQMERWLVGHAPRLSERWGAPAVVRSGRSQLFNSVTPYDDSRPWSDWDRRFAAELGICSGLIVPLTGRRGVFGTVTLLYGESGRQYRPEDVPFAEDVARRAALALETARLFEAQSDRLADLNRVAVAAQSAILAPPPPRVGPVALSARYLSAAAEARIGGDLYEVVTRPGAVRLLIGDVRGKGLAAVRTATIVLGEFRAAAGDIDDLVEVAYQIDRRLQPHLDAEDFVTAAIGELRDDGSFSICSCGHPPALLLSHRGVEELVGVPGLPLGVGDLGVHRPAPTIEPAGGQSRLVTGRLRPGDRLLLYTDGIIEGRRPDGSFVDMSELAVGLRQAPFSSALDELLGRLRAEIGADLGDDLALLLAEYRP